LKWRKKKQNINDTLDFASTRMKRTNEIILENMPFKKRYIWKKKCNREKGRYNAYLYRVQQRVYHCSRHRNYHSHIHLHLCFMKHMVQRNNWYKLSTYTEKCSFASRLKKYQCKNLSTNKNNSMETLKLTIY